MKKITKHKLQVTKIAFCLLLSAFCIIANAQTDEKNTAIVQEEDLILPQKIAEMVVTKLKNEPVERFYRYGIKNKEQFDNLQLGRAIREFVINNDNDTLMPQGWRIPVMYEGKALFLAKVFTIRDVGFGAPDMGESIRHYEREDLMGILSVKLLPSDFFYIRRENKDVFLQVFDPVTRKYFKNEYTLSEIINLRNRAIEIYSSPTKEGWKEFFDTNQVDENDIFDPNFPQKHELKITPEITEMLITEIYWDFLSHSDWSLSNFGITNRAQLENLQLGKPISKYRIDVDNENLIFTGEWEILVMSENEPLFITKVDKDEEQYSNTGGGRARWAKILHNYEYKDLIIGYLEFDREMNFYIIRKGHQDIFVQTYDRATREYLKNEYSFSEVLNLLKK